MLLLSGADALRVGATEIDRVKRGALEVWPLQQFFLDSLVGVNNSSPTARQSESGHNWSAGPASVGNGAISANRWRPSINASSSYLLSSVVASTPDYRVRGVLNLRTLITGTSNTMGVTGRASAADLTMYSARYVGNTQTWELHRFQAAGTPTTLLLGSAVQSGLALDTDFPFELVMIGNQISLEVAGGPTIGPFTNADITSPGQIGMRGSGSGVSNTAGSHLSEISAVAL